jgi:hypothetical protein
MKPDPAARAGKSVEALIGQRRGDAGNAKMLGSLPASVRRPTKEC